MPQCFLFHPHRRSTSVIWRRMQSYIFNASVSSASESAINALCQMNFTTSLGNVLTLGVRGSCASTATQGLMYNPGAALSPAQTSANNTYPPSTCYLAAFLGSSVPASSSSSGAGALGIGGLSNLAVWWASTAGSAGNGH